jgi:hypothetical protein
MPHPEGTRDSKSCRTLSSAPQVHTNLSSEARPTVPIEAECESFILVLFSTMEGGAKKGNVPTSPPNAFVTLGSGALNPLNLSSHLYRNIHGSLTSNSPRQDGVYQLISFGPSIEKTAGQMREQQPTTRSLLLALD